MTTIYFGSNIPMKDSTYPTNTTISSDEKCQNPKPRKNLKPINNQQNHTREIISQCGAKELWADA